MLMSKFCRIFVFVAVLAAASSAAATTRYVSQNGGGFSGGSACNGQTTISIGTMSNTTNSAGDHDYLCGTLTSPLTLNGNGASGNVVQVTFDTGSGFSFPAVPSGGAIIINGNYYDIDGGGGNCGYISTTSTNATCAVGYIKSTANGSGLANQVNSIAIMADSTTGVSIHSLMIGPIYTHTSVTDVSCPIPGCWGIRGYGANSLYVHNNTIHDLLWADDIGNSAPGSSTDIRIYNNEFYNFDHNAFGNSVSNSTFHDNHLHDMANWDTGNTDNYHHDGLHVFSEPGQTINGITEYNNLFDGDVGFNTTSWMYNEDNGGTFENLAEFNNVFFMTGAFNNTATPRYSCCGVLMAWGDADSSGSNAILVNNTVFGPGYYSGAGSGALLEMELNATFKNNLVDNGQNVMGVASGTTFVSGGLSNNAYEDAGTDHGTGGAANTFSWNGNQFSDWSTWKADSGEPGSVFNTNALFNLNALGQPGAGSTVINAGANLTSLCSTTVSTMPLTALCSDANGNPRPATGPWTIGAYAVGGSTTSQAPPQPPTGLKAVAN
jgi:hypothetical protein